jgi:hypothetical protein
VNPDEYNAAVRIIDAALRDSIGAHGPISKRYAKNAARRIAHELAKAQEKETHDA